MFRNVKNPFKKTTPEKKKEKTVRFNERSVTVIETSVSFIEVEAVKDTEGRGSLDDKEVGQKPKSGAPHRPSISVISIISGNSKQSFSLPLPSSQDNEDLSHKHSRQSSPTQSLRRIGSSSSLCDYVSEEDDADLQPTPLNRVQSFPSVAAVIFEVEPPEIKYAATAGTDPKPAVNPRASFSFSSPRDSIIKIEKEHPSQNLAEVAKADPGELCSPKFSLRISNGLLATVSIKNPPPEAEEEKKSSQDQDNPVPSKKM